LEYWSLSSMTVWRYRQASVVPPVGNVRTESDVQ
jgi:hypothetical protein